MKSPSWVSRYLKWVGRVFRRKQPELPTKYAALIEGVQTFSEHGCSQCSPGPKYDGLGEFLTQYDEYLDGNRSYTDLPPAPCERPNVAPEKKQ